MLKISRNSGYEYTTYINTVVEKKNQNAFRVICC